MGAEYKIKADHISKVFKIYHTSTDRLKEALSFSGKNLHTDFYAVNDISFNVRQGQIVGIMGTNGSGKSTLLKMITGIYEPTYGSLSVIGTISSLLELGTGFNMEYTGMENIFFYGTLMGFTKEQMQQKLEQIIDFAEIGDYMNQPVKTYSSGMFARLAFSCAIHVEPDILIVDEILSVGDMRFQAKCFRKFKQFRERGVTILYVGHDVAVMRTFCDTVIWMHQGRLVEIGDPTYISAKYVAFMHADTIQDKDGVHEFPVLQKRACDKNLHADQKLFSDSIAHWGTHMGIITSVGLYDEKGNKKSVFRARDSIRIEIRFDLCLEMCGKTDLKYLSIAFSIKNKEGTDLIVKTTADQNIRLQHGREQMLAFTFVSALADGEYYLVVALEDRREVYMSYYEYIEGACYFKMDTPGNILGIYDVDTTVTYRIGADRI